MFVKICALLCAGLAALCLASIPAPDEDPSIDLLEYRVAQSIRHVITRGLPELPRAKIYAYPRALRLVDVSGLSRGIVGASRAYDVEMWFLVATAYREGAFDNSTEGALGELSTFQVMPRNARTIRSRDPRCRLSTSEGAAYCSAAYLDKYRRECGDLECAFSYYASGRPYQIPRVRWMWRDRTSIADTLRSLYGGELRPREPVQISQYFQLRH